MKKIYLALIIIALIILDQISKISIESYFTEGSELVIIPGFFNLVLVYNKGVAFGMMSNWEDSTRQMILIIIGILASIMITWMYFKEYANSKIGSFCLSIIVAGAIGNVIDRIRIGKVVDFLDFYIKGNHWPAFNFADSYICIGVAILMFVKTSPKKELK